MIYQFLTQHNPNFEQHCSLVLNKYTSANPEASIHSGISPSFLQYDPPKSGYHIPNKCSVMFVIVIVALQSGRLVGQGKISYTP